MTKKQENSIRLLPLSLVDAPKLFHIANNIKIAGMMRDAFPNPYSLKDAENFITRQLEEEKSGVFGIFYHTDLAGIISLNRQTDVYRLSAELGYFVGEKYWNKGIASKSVEMITQYGFESLHLNRIFAAVFDPNKASMRVLEKNGYVLEGIKRKAIIKNNRILDEYFYAKLHEE